MKTGKEKLEELLKTFTLQEIRILEGRDRQFLALKKLFGNIKEPEIFLKLVVANALLSYQLQTKGEIYWENFSTYFSQHPNLEAFPAFLEKFNKRLLSAKIKRFKKILPCIEKENLFMCCENLRQFIENISKCLKQKKDAKTIVFSAKMLLYACRLAKNKEITAPLGIFIPMDSRIQKLTKDKNFWLNIESQIGISLLHIDSILWITMGANKEEIEKLPYPLQEKVQKLKEFIYGII